MTPNTPSVQTNTPAVVSLSPEQQRGWVTIGQWKYELAERQKLKSLELQKLLLEPGTTITDMENTLAAYRKTHSEMVKDGQDFRKIINDKVLQPSLDIEKEYSPNVNDDYLILDKKLLDMKVSQDNDRKKSQAKQQEKADYIAYVKNQYIILENDLRTRAANETNTMYISYLKTAVQEPDTESIKKVILEMKLSPAVPFVAKYLSDEEKKAATADLVKPNFTEIRKELAATVDTKFASYQHDLSAGTIEQVEQNAQQEVAAIAKETAIEIGVNEMTAQSVVPLVETEGKKLKRLQEVVIEGTEAWHLAVIAAYLRSPLCRAYVSVKAWENLTVKQMAAALGKYASETGEIDPALTYREAVK